MEQLTDIPEILSVLPSRNAPVYPTAMSQLTVAEASTLCLLDDSKNSHRLLVVAARKTSESTPANLSDLFQVGTLARLALMRSTGNGKREITLLGLERVIIGTPIQEQPYLQARVVLKPDIVTPQDMSISGVRETITVFKKLLARSQKMSPREVVCDFAQASLREQIYAMACSSLPDLERGQRLLELDAPAARLAQLQAFLRADLEQFDQQWQAASRRVQEQVGSKFEVALDMLHTAATIEDTFQVLSEHNSLLSHKKALAALRSRIACCRQQRVTKRWIFLLIHDLDLLERAHRHGLHIARGYLGMLCRMRENQQAILEALKLLTTLDIDNPETLATVIKRQETQPFSPATFAALYALGEQVEDPEDSEQLQAILHLLEDVQKLGKEEALAKHVQLRHPGLDNEIACALDVLEAYLTSRSPQEAFVVLQRQQELLLSELMEQLLRQRIAERYRSGDRRGARMLEVHLALFADARQRGLEAAWHTFLADI
ncbi:MAG TPA: LON peptidase substrate-binding domain-containing protein [Ktedonobacteraceae bacterium]